MSVLLSEAGDFISVYSAHMMGCGVHTSRVLRCARRIGESLGYKVVVSFSQKNIVVSVTDPSTGEHYNDVREIPALPISFEHNARLSALSWEAYDSRLSLDELRSRYSQVLGSPSIHPFFVLVTASLANASFCRLFGGDWLSMGIVFSSTMTGMYLKQRMAASGVNHYIVFIVSSFVASLCASVSLIFNTTAETALATSVLFLVPGVPLINGVIDIVEGFPIVGFSRLIQALLLIVCIATGLSFTLLMFKDSLL